MPIQSQIGRINTIVFIRHSFDVCDYVVWKLFFSDGIRTGEEKTLVGEGIYFAVPFLSTT